MSGVTYGEWWSRMRQQAALDSIAESRRDLRTQRLELENQKLKERVLQLERKTKEEVRDEQIQSDRWA